MPITDPSSVTNHYDRFDYTKGYSKIMQLADKGSQSAEQNELQSILVFNNNAFMDALIKQDAILSGLGVNVASGNITCSQGFLRGGAYAVFTPERVINLAGKENSVLGILITVDVITEADDTSLRNPAVGTPQFGQPGAYRVRRLGQWAFQQDVTPQPPHQRFIPLYQLNNSVPTALQETPLRGQPVRSGDLIGNTLPSNIIYSSLTSVGTITTGVWNGTDISYDRIQQASSTSVLGNPTASVNDVQPIAATASGQILQRSGSSLTFDKLDVSSSASVANVLRPINGGTGNTYFRVNSGLTAERTYTFPNANATIAYTGMGLYSFTFTGPSLAGRIVAGSGAVQSITVGDGLRFSGSSLAVNTNVVKANDSVGRLTMGGNQLLGRSSATTGVVTAISLGAGLGFSGSSLAVRANADSLLGKMGAAGNAQNISIGNGLSFYSTSRLRSWCRAPYGIRPDTSNPITVSGAGYAYTPVLSDGNFTMYTELPQNASQYGSGHKTYILGARSDLVRGSSLQNQAVVQSYVISDHFEVVRNFPDPNSPTDIGFYATLRLKNTQRFGSVHADYLWADKHTPVNSGQSAISWPGEANEFRIVTDGNYIYVGGTNGAPNVAWKRVALSTF